MNRIRVTLDQSEAQTIMLALGHLSAERPGWDDMLQRIAEQFNGTSQYLQHRDLRRCELGQQKCEDHE